MSTLLCVDRDYYPGSSYCAADPVADVHALETEFVDFASDTEDLPPPGYNSSKSWLLRLACPRLSVRKPAHARKRISSSERARHAILDLRLRRPYLLYCLAVSGATSFLLVWNLIKGVQNQWNLPMWKHHRWEEVLEILIGVLIVIETTVTLKMLGCRSFFGNRWCIFDFCVTLLTTLSIAYGLKHLGRKGEIVEADMPLLMVRFVLQPTRVLLMAVNSYRAQRMQAGVDELRVDFDCLPAQGTAWEPLQDFGTS